MLESLKPGASSESTSRETIARACGLSVATVSLALNGHPRVPERTRRRVQEAARRLGWVANHSARQLIRRRYDRLARVVERVGLVLFDKRPEPLQTVYLAFLVGVERRIADSGGTVTFVREAAGAPEARLANLARSGAVDGFILAGDVDDAAVRKAEQAGLPFVVLGDQHASVPVFQAALDFAAMGRLAVRRLYELGHRRIGFLGATMRFVYQREIRDGARAELAALGLPAGKEAFWTGEGTTDPNFAAPVRRLLASRPLPTAVVLGEPRRAVDSVHGLFKARGVKIPERLSLVACESSDAFQVLAGSAYVDASTVDAGVAAVDLLREVAATNAGEPRRVLIAPRWVEGWSVRQRVC